MTITTMQQFNSKLSSVVRRSKTLRDDVQQLTVFGVDQVEAHGNLTPLTNLLKATKPLRTIRTSTLEAYIFAQVGGIEWKGKGKDAALAKVKDKDISVERLEVVWYEYDNDGVEMKELDIDGRIKSLLAAITKADKEDGLKFKEGTENKAHQLAEILEAFESGDVEVSVVEDLAQAA